MENRTRDAYILESVRSPRGRGRAGKGAISSVHPQELLGQTLNRLVEKAKVSASEVSDVVCGVVSQAGEQGSCVVRNAILAAGWPDDVTGVTVNRYCGSGLQAVNFAAMTVMSGQSELTVGGGVESMSRCPMGSDGGGVDGNNPHLRKRVFQVPQGISADLIATIEGISREEVDAFALASQKKAGVAIAEGRFNNSLFAVKDPETGKVLLEKDEHPRPETTPEGLAKLERQLGRIVVPKTDNKGKCREVTQWVLPGNQIVSKDGQSQMVKVRAGEIINLGGCP